MKKYTTEKETQYYIDLEQYKYIINDYKNLGRNYLLMFASKENRVKKLKDSTMEYLLSELKYRKDTKNNYKLTYSEVIKILETEILYRRKEKIDKIKQNINI